MLSNTATPVHYAAFREKVLSGEIPVCEEISLAMQRIDVLVADPTVYYDDGAIDGFIEFSEAELCLTDGGEVHLLDSFKLWAEDLLAWKIFVVEPQWDDDAQDFIPKTICKRLRDTQYLIVARGAAKSMYVSFLQAYFLICDLDTTTGITVAPTMVQADEVMSPIKTAITIARGPVFKLLTYGSINNTTGNRAMRQKLAATKKGIENFATNSTLSVRPMSIDKVQGLRSKYNSVDEWLSGDTRENVITALKQGASKFIDPVTVAISSEGTIRNGVGDTIKMELASILRGEQLQWNVSIWHYKLDDVSEVKDPTKWKKANPNLGITVSYNTYKEDVARAELNIDARNEILAKRFGLPMEGYSFFFTFEEIQCHYPQDFRGMKCALGIDLSRGDDFCAFTFLFPMGNERFGIQTRSYISQRTLDLLPYAKYVKYQEFIREGSLVVFEGSVLDMMDVYDDIEAHWIAQKYVILTVGYDTYNAKTFMERYERFWGPHGIEKVIQGAKTESVPLGELKKLARDRKLVFYEKIMNYTLGYAAVWLDTNGNRKLFKRRTDEKIDNVSALLDAFIAWSRHPEDFE